MLRFDLSRQDSTPLQLHIMKLFNNISLVAMKFFLSHSSVFYRRVALLCGSKKASIESKIFSISTQ